MARVIDVERAHSLALNLDAQRAVRTSLAALDVEQGGLYARRLRLLADLDRLSVARSAHAVLEVAGTLGVGQGRATTLLEHGRRAVVLFPRAVELLETGALHQATVELLLYLTAKYSEAVQAEAGARVIDLLIDCDAVDARALIVATLLEVEADLDPDGVKERHAQARANRGVWVKPVEHGMARIGAEVDQIAARRFQLDLDELCRAQKLTDDATGLERTVEQRRADVLAELPSRHLQLLQAYQQGQSAADLLGAEGADRDVRAELFALPVRNPLTLYVHTPMTTLLDLDNRSGWVEGLGPINAHQSRLLRPTAALQALWVDCTTGLPLGIDPKVVPPDVEPDWQQPEQITLAAERARERLRSLLHPTVVTHPVEPGRFPSPALARYVKVRDLRCTGVGCPMPASRCEIDHLVPVSEGGLTQASSLALKSPRCHHARHDGWMADRDAADGSTLWSSPAGGEYTRRSPWHPPPRITGPLPPATLDRPDGGGKPRTFGLDTDADPPEPQPETPPVRSTRKTALDILRERPRTPKAAVPRWDGPWHTDAPPPF